MRTTTLTLCLCLWSCNSAPRGVDSYVLREHMAVDLSESSARSLEVLLGKGHVLVVSGERLSCDAYVDITANSEASAKELAQGMQLTPEEDMSGVLRVSLQHDEVTALDSAHAFFRFTVPPSMELSILSGQADVTLHNYSGKVRVRTGSGRIRVDMSGDGEADLVNQSGSTELTGSYGDAKIHSSDGAIIAELPQTENQGMVRLNMTSDSGQIILRATEHDNLEMTFETDRGRMQTDLPLRLTEMPSDNGRQLQFTGGMGNQSGAIEVQVDSESGDFRVIRRPVQERAKAGQTRGSSAQQRDQLSLKLGHQPFAGLGTK